MVKRVRRSNVKDGVLLPLGNGFSLAIGKHPEKTDDIDIGPNNKNGLSVNHGEILQQKGNTLRVFSAEPMLNGASPAQLLYGGANPNAVFEAQEQYKKTNRIADDGTKYRKGGKKQTPLKEGIDWSDIKTTGNRAYNSEYIDYINKSLTSRGFGKNQRAAILANIIEESGGNPFAVDGTGNFKGLLQWEKSRYWPGDETDVYKELDNQIQYIADTVGNSTDRKSWTHGGKGSGYNSLTDAMAAYNSEDDLEATMRGYTLGYVRPAGGINSYNNRLKVAKQIVDREGFKNGGDKDDFKTIKERTDFKQTGIKKFIVDKFGKWYYPNPVGVHGDFSRFYFGRPTENNTFYKSKYKPSKSKNNNSIYYGVKTPEFLSDLVYLYNNRPIEKLLQKEGNAVIDGYKARTSSDLDSAYIGDNIERYHITGDLYGKKSTSPSMKDFKLSDSVGALGNFTIGRGKDDKGEYLSYYDLWDVSNLAEKYGLAKPYEIYDRIYGKFDNDGRFHPEGEISPSIITTNKKYGGIYIKPSKRGTFTAAAKQHGMSVQGFASKVLANKENYSPAMVKKANFARNASKWNHLYGGENILTNPLGERPNAKYEKEMKNKRNKADRGGIQSIGSGGFLNPFIDQYGNTIDVNGNITQLKVPEGTLVNPPKITPINNTNRGLTATGADAIGAGINTLGALIGAGIQQGAINKLKFTPRQYALLDPVKLKTKINIAPQIAKMREMQAQINDAARRTSASSRNAYQRIAAGHSRLLDSTMSLYGQKENMETELINQDLLNQQQVRQANAKNVMDTINYNNAGETELRNRKRVLTSNNWTTALNTISGAWAGPNGFIDKQNARRVKAGELYTQAIANPDAARILYGDIDFTTDANKRKAFKTIYDFLNNNKLG